MAELSGEAASEGKITLDQVREAFTRFNDALDESEVRREEAYKLAEEADALLKRSDFTIEEVTAADVEHVSRRKREVRN